MNKIFLLILLYIVITFLTACNDETTLISNIDTDTGAFVNLEKSLRSLYKAYDVPGASFAISKDGILEHSYCFGYANKSTKEPVTDSSIFRIASVSKPITSVAIMKLIEQVKLSINDTVFGDNGILGNTYGTQAYSDREKHITVQHLLEHTAGGESWDNEGENDSSDPIYTNPDFNHTELINWVLDTREPSIIPGTSFYYSNFGYCLLGRIIEKLTNISYEDYVVDSILKPMGIINMKIGGNKKSDKFHNEVEYYDKYWTAYGLNMTLSDANGGWIASAIDLINFSNHVDGFNSVEDILDSSTIQLMVSPSELEPGYAKGWGLEDSGKTWLHFGGLPGTSSLLVRFSNGISWVLLMNTTDYADEFYSDFYIAVNEELAKINDWPNEENN